MIYVLRRFVNYAILTIVATVLAYIGASLTLSPATRYEGRSPRPSQHTIDSLLDKLNSNPHVPLAERTWIWAKGIALHGDFGLNSAFDPVRHDLIVRSGVSLQLLLAGSLLGALLGVTLGVWGAVRQYRFSDQAVTYLSYVILATPVFVIGVILMILAVDLNNAIGRQLISFTGQYTPGIDGFWGTLGDRLSHLLLPTIALALTGAAEYSRYQRSAMLDVLGADFIRTARAKGHTRSSALIRHGVRVALIPMSTYFAYSFGTLVAGSTFLEIVFSWNGMGQLAITSITTNDINSSAAVVFYVSVVVLISSTLSEILYAALDPRVRLG